MYEIVKKKNLTLKIITGIVALFVLTSVLKVFLKQPDISINEQLVLISNEINKDTPITVDSLTRLDNVSAWTGNRLQYNYTITNVETTKIDTTLLMANTKQTMINMIKTNPKAAYFRENKIDIVVNYSDPKGRYICKLIIPHEEY